MKKCLSVWLLSVVDFASILVPELGMDDDPPCQCECGGEEFESVQELAWFEELEVSLKDDADDGAAAAQCAFVVSELCEVQLL